MLLKYNSALFIGKAYNEKCNNSMIINTNAGINWPTNLFFDLHIKKNSNMVIAKPFTPHAIGAIKAVKQNNSSYVNIIEVNPITVNKII